MNDRQRRHLQRHFPDHGSHLNEILNRYDMYRVDNPPVVKLDFESGLSHAIGTVARAQIKLKKLLATAKEDSQSLGYWFVALEEGCEFDGHPSYAEYLKSDHWRSVRDKAIDRAGGLCMLCNGNDGGLHVHHRTYERLGEEEDMDVIVLCASHHAQFHCKDGGK